MDFILIGDEASPADFELPGCDFYGLERQRSARACDGRCLPDPALRAQEHRLPDRDGARRGDDRRDRRRHRRLRRVLAAARVDRRRPLVVRAPGWVNVYSLLLRREDLAARAAARAAAVAPPARESLPIAETVWCPIQQGLVDDDPDVDAIYRLVLDLPFQFEPGASVALGPGAWCPFNSQNTSWWPEAYPLMYLPAYCSFRMTDIWRSFVAQRIAWVNGWSVLFHEATVRQRAKPTRPAARLSRRGARVPREQGDLCGAAGARARARRPSDCVEHAPFVRAAGRRTAGSTRESFRSSMHGLQTSPRSARAKSKR